MNYPAVEELIEIGQVLINGSVSPSIKMIRGSLIADALPELRLLLANEKKLEEGIEFARDLLEAKRMVTNADLNELDVTENDKLRFRIGELTQQIEALQKDNAELYFKSGKLTKLELKPK